MSTLNSNNNEDGGTSTCLDLGFCDMIRRVQGTSRVKSINPKSVLKTLACALHRLFEQDWVLRWDSEQDGSTKDVFEALGGQLWGSRLSLFSKERISTAPYCDTVLTVIKLFGTKKVVATRWTNSIYPVGSCEPPTSFAAAVQCFPVGIRVQGFE